MNIYSICSICMGFPSRAVVKNLPANAGDARDAGYILGQEDPQRRKWQAAPVLLAWKIAQTEQPGGLQSMGSQRVGRDCVHKHTLAQRKYGR